jgi:hypothetical protein
MRNRSGYTNFGATGMRVDEIKRLFSAENRQPVSFPYGTKTLRLRLNRSTG